MPVNECWIGAASEHRFPHIVDRSLLSKLCHSSALTGDTLNRSVSIVPNANVCSGQFMSIWANVSGALSHSAILARTARRK
jgi:hypothetical protein